MCGMNEYWLKRSEITYTKSHYICLATNIVKPCVSKSRSISTPRLKPLLALHLEPINVVVFHGPHK